MSDSGPWRSVPTDGWTKELVARWLDIEERKVTLAERIQDDKERGDNERTERQAAYVEMEERKLKAKERQQEIQRERISVQKAKLEAEERKGR